MGDDFISYSFDANCFMERCLKFKHGVEPVTVAYRVYKDMEKTQKKSHLFLICVFFLPLCHSFSTVPSP
jgi:hypothetical protein